MPGPVHEPPFVVLREGRDATPVPIAEFFDMQDAARQLVHRHLRGDVAAARQIAMIYELAAGRGAESNDERRRAIVSTYLLVRCREEAERMRAYQPPAPAAPEAEVVVQPSSVNGAPPAPPRHAGKSWCNHGIEHTAACQACGRGAAAEAGA